MMMVRVLIQLPRPLKAKLDALRQAGHHGERVYP